MKQTAVEWLLNQMNKSGFNLDKMDLNIFQQAKEMEKQQIIEAFKRGTINEMNGIEEIGSEQYYNKTFKNKQ
jgi:hypothetical protein